MRRYCRESPSYKLVSAFKTIKSFFIEINGNLKVIHEEYKFGSYLILLVSRAVKNQSGLDYELIKRVFKV